LLDLRSRFVQSGKISLRTLKVPVATFSAAEIPMHPSPDTTVYLVPDRQKAGEVEFEVKFVGEAKPANEVKLVVRGCTSTGYSTPQVDWMDDHCDAIPKS
jgi:hypothetical protein